MRRLIKDLLKGGADVYELEQRVAQLQEALNNVSAELEANTEIDLYKVGDHFYFVFTDDEAYFDNHVAPKHLDPSTVAKEVTEKKSLPPRDPRAALYGGKEAFSPLEMLFLHYMATGQDFTFVDVGANIGTTCIPAASFIRAFGGQHKTVTFECTRKTFDLLCHNIELNRFSHIIEPVNLAVSDISAKAIIFKERGYSGHNRINNPFSDRDYRKRLKAPSEIVTTITLDDAAAKFGISTPIILKVDTEGNEPRVVTGAKGLMSQHPTPMILEFAPVNIRAIRDPADFLAEINRSHFILDWPPLVRSEKYKVLREDVVGFIDAINRNGHGWSDLCCVPRDMDGAAQFMERCATGS